MRRGIAGVFCYNRAYNKLRWYVTGGRGEYFLGGEYGANIFWLANMGRIFSGWRIWGEYFLAGEYYMLGDSRGSELAEAVWLILAEYNYGCL